MTTDHRTNVINGLINLAAFLEANPTLPVSYGDISVRYFPRQDTDAAAFAEIDQIAAQLGTEVTANATSREHYSTMRTFGPVAYEAVAIPAASMARYRAESSYRDCVEPD
ncbi:hypothetical protein [Nonomuraea typhae]|uniref:hypothetical protein n=1 Tax=Nonomuraea typhae TaxID=2603600 RepID=UPI0012F8E50F|nr:hypothetical protein [Nonomuraea typhae]